MSRTVRPKPKALDEYSGNVCVIAEERDFRQVNMDRVQCRNIWQIGRATGSKYTYRFLYSVRQQPVLKATIICVYREVFFFKQGELHSKFWKYFKKSS